MTKPKTKLPPKYDTMIRRDQAKKNKARRARNRALKGLSPPEPVPEGKPERDYQAKLEAKGQRTIFDAIGTEDKRHVAPPTPKKKRKAAVKRDEPKRGEDRKQQTANA